MTINHDPMGAAIADFWRNGIAGRLRVFSPGFDEDEMPVADLFRTFDEMPPLEQTALRLATGRTLDVGAGAGCHSLALLSAPELKAQRAAGIEVTAIDISPLSVQTMQAQGVSRAFEQDFWTIDEQYDTILMLMNGIGIVGTLDTLPRFFTHIDSILSPDGQLIIDSSDVRYVYEDEEEDPSAGLKTSYLRRNEQGIEIDPETGRYYGEYLYQMQYKRIRGEQFHWLYIDFATLSHAAEAAGFNAELIEEGEHYDYLARIKRAKS